MDLGNFFLVLGLLSGGITFCLGVYSAAEGFRDSSGPIWLKTFVIVTVISLSLCAGLSSVTNCNDFTKAEYGAGTVPVKCGELPK